MRAGALLHRRTGLPILVTGGTLRTSEPPVAALMADSLVHDFQVPARWVERESRDTWENARLSAAILHEQGITSVYVVTQAWHMRRAIVAFADTGITVTAAPTLLRPGAHVGRRRLRAGGRRLAGQLLRAARVDRVGLVLGAMN